MSLVGIEYVWHRQITRGDFFNIDSLVKSLCRSN